MQAVTLFAFAVILSIPATSFAQPARGYISGAGGFSTAPDGTSPDWLGEGGLRVAPNLFVTGAVGRFQNLQPSALEPAVDATTLVLSNAGVVVDGTARVPAWYTTGGLRVQIPTGRHVTPYAFGSVGIARLTPHATFSYQGGALTSASGATSPSTGDDVTPEIVSLGDFTQPPSSNALMVSGGGGVQLPIARRIAVDVGYRVSRVNADTPLTTQGMTFGVGYRF